MRTFACVITGTGDKALADDLALGLTQKLQAAGCRAEHFAMYGEMDMRLGWLRMFGPGGGLGSTEPSIQGQGQPQPYLYASSFLFAWYGAAPEKTERLPGGVFLESLLDDGAAAFLTSGLQNVHGVPVYGATGSAG